MVTESTVSKGSALLQQRGVLVNRGSTEDESGQFSCWK